MIGPLPSPRRRGVTLTASCRGRLPRERRRARHARLSDARRRRPRPPMDCHGKLYTGRWTLERNGMCTHTLNRTVDGHSKETVCAHTLKRTVDGHLNERVVNQTKWAVTGVHTQTVSNQWTVTVSHGVGGRTTDAPRCHVPSEQCSGAGCRSTRRGEEIKRRDFITQLTLYSTRLPF